MNLYVIYDRVAEQSGPIFEAINDGIAFRQYEQVMRQATIPDDYMLLRVGSIDHDINKVDTIYPAEEIYVGLSKLGDDDEE